MPIITEKLTAKDFTYSREIEMILVAILAMAVKDVGKIKKNVKNVE